MDFLSKSSPATASNLEQGNIISSIKFSKNEHFRINLGFSSESEVFFDYLSEKASIEKVTGELSKFFEIDLDKIEFDLSFWKK